MLDIWYLLAISFQPLYKAINSAWIILTGMNDFMLSIFFCIWMPIILVFDLFQNVTGRICSYYPWESMGVNILNIGTEIFWRQVRRFPTIIGLMVWPYYRGLTIAFMQEKNTGGMTIIHISDCFIYVGTKYRLFQDQTFYGLV